MLCSFLVTGNVWTMTYCWRKESCTSWYIIYFLIYRVVHPRWFAGFLPSTVSISWCRFDEYPTQRSMLNKISTKEDLDFPTWRFTPSLRDASMLAAFLEMFLGGPWLVGDDEEGDNLELVKLEFNWLDQWSVLTDGLTLYAVWNMFHIFLYYTKLQCIGFLHRSLLGDKMWSFPTWHPVSSQLQSHHFPSNMATVPWLW